MRREQPTTTLSITVRIALPPDSWDAAVTTNEVATYFKLFVNALEVARHKVSFSAQFEEKDRANEHAHAVTHPQ